MRKVEIIDISDFIRNPFMMDEFCTLMTDGLASFVDTAESHGIMLKWKGYVETPDTIAEDLAAGWSYYAIMIDGKMVGGIEVSHDRSIADARCLEFICIIPEHRGNGYAAVATIKVMEMEELKHPCTKRFTLKAYRFSHNSRAICKALGFGELATILAYPR